MDTQPTAPQGNNQPPPPPPGNNNAVSRPMQVKIVDKIVHGDTSPSGVKDFLLPFRGDVNNVRETPDKKYTLFTHKGREYFIENRYSVNGDILYVGNDDYVYLMPNPYTPFMAQMRPGGTNV
jgi:hypothetical protein